MADAAPKSGVVTPSTRGGRATGIMGHSAKKVNARFRAGCIRGLGGRFSVAPPSWRHNGPARCWRYSSAAILAAEGAPWWEQGHRGSMRVISRSGLDLISGPACGQSQRRRKALVAKDLLIQAFAHVKHDVHRIRCRRGRPLLVGGAGVCGSAWPERRARRPGCGAGELRGGRLRAAPAASRSRLTAGTNQGPM